jgi:hypothetical protein
MPAALQGRMDAAQYAALTRRVNVALGPASRSRLSALGTFLGMVAVFLIILAGQQLHLTRDHYFGLLALSLLLWCSTLLLIVTYLLYVRPITSLFAFPLIRYLPQGIYLLLGFYVREQLRRVATTLAEVGYDHQRLGFNLRMMWWPWAVYADLHPVVPDHQPLQEVVAPHHQPYPVFVAAPSHGTPHHQPTPSIWPLPPFSSCPATSPFLFVLVLQL